METQLAKCRIVASPSPRRQDAAAAPPRTPSVERTLPTLLNVSVLVARGGWIDLRSGKHLQEASGTLCRDCREHVGSHLRVNHSTPRLLWPLRMTGNVLPASGKPASLPPLRVTGMTWERPLGDLARGRALPAGLENLKFACSFRYFDVEWVTFPSTLLSVSFGQNFDQSIDSVAWPPHLQRLAFGWEFNRSIDGAQWPPGLKRLTFGQSFDRPIHAVSWPLALEELTFGGRFNQPIHGGVFPPGLRYLTFGWRFNQPIVEVAWPPRLQRLMFGSLFNQVRARGGGGDGGGSVSCFFFNVSYKFRRVRVSRPCSGVRYGTLSQGADRWSQPRAYAHGFSLNVRSLTNHSP